MIRVFLCALVVFSLTACEIPEEPKPPAPPSPIEPANVKYPKGDGYVQFVNRDEAPNAVYHIRGVFQITIRDQFLVIEDTAGDHFLVPQARVIYAGIEFK